MAWRYSTYLYCTISLMSLTPIHRFRVVRQACCKIARNRNLLWVATSLLHTPECFFSCHNLLQISKYFPYLFVETIGDFREKQEVQVVWRVRKLQAHSRSLQRKVKKMYLETFIRTKKNQLWQWNTSSLALEYKESGDVFRPRRLQRALTWCHAHSVTGIAWLLINLAAQRLMSETHAQSQTPTLRGSEFWGFVTIWTRKCTESWSALLANLTSVVL